MEIAEDKLFRIVKLTKGQYEGEHKIYWNKHIWSLFEVNSNIYVWGDCLQCKAGDWIETYDGTVMQALDVRRYKDKKNRTFYFFRFPVATTYAWTNHQGITKYRQLQGNFMTAGRHTMKLSTVSGSGNQKVRFATYVVSGLNPLKAFRLAFNNFAPMSVTTIHRKVNQLMADEIVQTELHNQLQPFIESLREKFPDQRLINELDLLLHNSRKGSMAHRENLKFIMALLDKLPQAMYPHTKKDKALAVETDYLEEKPPQALLGSQL